MTGIDVVERALDLLNGLLRRELAAVESYFQAMEAFVGDPALRQQLRECQRSHQIRVDALRARVRLLDGEPTLGAGPWAPLLAAICGGPDARTALGALTRAEDEDHRTAERDLDLLDPDSRRFLAVNVMPELERTRVLVRELLETHA
jgi:hypothetical protein